MNFYFFYNGVFVRRFKTPLLMYDGAGSGPTNGKYPFGFFRSCEYEPTVQDYLGQH